MKQGWRLAVVAVALLVAFGLGRSAWRQHALVAEAAPPVPGAAAASLSASASAAVPVAASAPAAAASVPAAAAGGLLPAQLTELLAQVPAEGLEICGVGRLKAPDLLRMLMQPDQARAWYEAGDKEAERRAAQAVVRVAGQLAAGSELQQVAARVLMQDADGAATLAERSPDAAVYAMALAACDAAPRVGACGRLDARRWAELDPQDARPWLRLLQQARERQDEAGVDAALAELARRPRYSRAGQRLEGALLPVLGGVPDAEDRFRIQVRAIGMDALWGLTDAGALGRACGPALGPQRQAHCRSAARQMLAATDSLSEARLSLRLADRLGVPPAELAYDAATLDAAMKALQQQGGDLDFDCASHRRMAAWSAERAVQGELAFGLAQVRRQQAAASAPR